jgi:hypothetical protein
VQFVDYDNDGALDLTVTDGYGEVGGHFVFRNELPDEARTAQPERAGARRARPPHAFGAEVRLFDRRPICWQARPVVTGGGYNTQRAAPVHVGLPSLAPVTVEVTFMTMVAARDERFGISSERKRQERADIPAPEVAAGADAWSRGRVVQLEDPTGAGH